MMYGVGPRYLAPTIPLMLIIASAALARLDERWTYAGAAVALLVILHGVPVLAYPLRASMWGDTVMTEHREAGRWILERYGSGKRIVTRGPEAAYYARGERRLLDDIEPDDVAVEARRTGSDFVVVDELLTRRHNPRLVPLLEGTPARGLRLVHDMTPHPGRRVRIFTPAD